MTFIGQLDCSYHAKQFTKAFTISSSPFSLDGTYVNTECKLLLIFLKCLCVVLLCVFTFRVPLYDVRYNFHIKRCSVRLYLQLFVGVLVSYLRCLRIVVSNTYCFCFVFLRRVYLMLPVSLVCPFLIAPSVFSNVYLR
jgi:hypothetical protein